MLNIGILASTRGTDMQAVIDAIERGELDAKISVVISNKKDAYALERARKHNIKAVFLEAKGKEREEFDREVAKILDENGVELILLIGYMRYLSKWFVDKYRNKIMNIHPSLLPAFAGGMDKNVHAEILKYGCKVSGCTLHFVDEGADTGPIIAQKAVPIEEGETVDSLKEKVQKAEQEIIIKAIKLFAENKLKVEGRRVKILQ
ncbi:MAG: phosphoribosylglycinamide formyltransferase [Candidatus Aenigmatarchaeota archaeon]|nr:MAG: phosphoribosylglycinamide formyltransferase [Candidatus Aenigmarchaeota archaeon ex4484_14]RLI97645.1 MAG: phosphoribosylglycinamide formyltransferase [Candidatus Aenigmarchaeota archaeon]